MREQHCLEYKYHLVGGKEKGLGKYCLRVDTLDNYTNTPLEFKILKLRFLKYFPFKICVNKMRKD